jgi:hypothetical protein
LRSDTGELQSFLAQELPDIILKHITATASSPEELRQALLSQICSPTAEGKKGNYNITNEEKNWTGCGQRYNTKKVKSGPPQALIHSIPMHHM